MRLTLYLLSYTPFTLVVRWCHFCSESKSVCGRKRSQRELNPRLLITQANMRAKLLCEPQLSKGDVLPSGRWDLQERRVETADKCEKRVRKGQSVCDTGKKSGKARQSRSRKKTMQQHSWSKGRIPPFQGGDPGSSPGGCTFLVSGGYSVCQCDSKEQKASAAGLEPATPRSEVWCASDCAMRPSSSVRWSVWIEEKKKRKVC